MILRSTLSYSQVCVRTLFAGCLLAVAGSSGAASADSSVEEEGVLASLAAAEPNASEADCDEVYLLKPPTPHVMRPGAEWAPVSRFTVPWGDEPRQLIGVTPVLDNKQVIGDFRIGIASATGSELVYQWQPGDAPPRLPAGIGQYLPSGSAARLTLQSHYRNLTGAVANDTSGARLCVVKGAHLRENVAGLTDTFGASDAAGIPSHVRTYMVGRTCRVRSKEPVTLVTVAPTMRTSGRGAIATVHPSGGTKWNFYAGAFDYANRQTTLLQKPVVLQPNDIVDFSCIFAPPHEKTRLFGDSLADETCVMYTTYYPHGALDCAPLNTSVDYGT